MNQTLLFSSFSILNKDFIEYLSFVEPTDINLKCFSQRSFELFLRIATDFENISKQILIDNNYSNAKREQDYWNIEDYKKILDYCELENLTIRIITWRPNPRDFSPFKYWRDNHLQWYRDYNTVKHNRQDAFEKATLENLCLGMCSLVAIYYKLYGQEFFIPFAGVKGFASKNNPFDIIKPIPETFYVVKYPNQPN